MSPIDATVPNVSATTGGAAAVGDADRHDVDEHHQQVDARRDAQQAHRAAARAARPPRGSGS